MTERPVDLSQLPSSGAARRSLFSARKFALMASIIAGLGAAVYGFAPQQGPLDVFTSAAHAQVDAKVERPIGFADIVERVKPSVISVKINIAEKTAKGDDNADRMGLAVPAGFADGALLPPLRWSGWSAPGLRGGPRGGRGPVTGQGSGFFISPDGFAVTNNHVVDGADKVEVTMDDGKTFTAKVIGTDPRTDLALIKVEGSKDFPFAKLSDSKPRIGDWVLAVGNPFGLGDRDRRYRLGPGREIGTDRMTTSSRSTPREPGNSGGPTFNQRRSDRRQHAIYLAVRWQCRHRLRHPRFDRRADRHPAARTRARSCAAGSVSRSSRSTAGITTASAEDEKGALVAEPGQWSGGQRPALKAGDVDHRRQRHRSRMRKELARSIGGLAPGTTIKLNVLADGARSHDH